MKSEKYFIINDQVRENAVLRINNIPADGKLKVVISNAGDKSAKQRGIQWIWNTEVAEAGIGGKHEDTKNGVHLVSKWRWAIPILLRDDDFFSSLYSAWFHLHGKDEDRMKWFVCNHVHTETLSTSQMAEYLTEFQRYYGPLVNLTDPKERGLIS